MPLSPGSRASGDWDSSEALWRVEERLYDESSVLLSLSARMLPLPAVPGPSLSMRRAAGLLGAVRSRQLEGK